LPDWIASLDQFLFRFVTQNTLPGLMPVFVPLGLVLGFALAWWSDRIIARESDGRRRLGRPGRIAVVIASTLLFPGLVFAVTTGQALAINEAGTIDFAQWRLPFHFILLSLLIVATAVDIDQYLIPDDITGTGMLIGVIWSAAFGHMYLVPVWIDWNDAHPLVGPYIPEWIKLHPHWHGLACSLAGLATGAGLTWLARLISRGMLKVEALGFGDVTLMAMIGSFLGWQPMLFVFLIAPVCALAASAMSRLLHGRRAIPYGPYLSASALIVLFIWRSLWIPTRDLFGHWPSLAALAVLMIGGLVALLGLLRLYRAIPATRSRTSGDDGS
jgi:leader peptidase (prepilin peptidase)/N-methyltransferase